MSVDDCGGGDDVEDGDEKTRPLLGDTGTVVDMVELSTSSGEGKDSENKSPRLGETVGDSGSESRLR